MDNPSTIVEFTRIYLAVFYSGVAAFYAIRITAKKRTGLREVVFPGERFNSTWWNHMLFRLFRWPYPVIDSYLGIFDNLNVWPIVLAGNILLTAGFLFTVLIHFSWGRQWRSGIDPCGPEKLKTDGFYKYSRNPVFLGIATAQVGFFLALPSVFSSVCLLVGLYTLHIQTLAEEAHLINMFPKDYRHYKDHVRRWL
jgi:protein-S-isoprenylcysteine O-methyltransferase Ste14